MKKLENSNMEELTRTEIITIQGGNWFTDALDALEDLVVDKIQEVIDEVIDDITSYREG